MLAVAALVGDIPAAGGTLPAVGWDESGGAAPRSAEHEAEDARRSAPAKRGERTSAW